MKASERRLLMLFLTLAVVMGSVLLGQRLRTWQQKLERKEREAELQQMESTALLQQAPEWLVKGQWLAQAQPVVTSDFNANDGLLTDVTSTAAGAGLDVVKTQIEQVIDTDYYRQFGVGLVLRGKLPELMRWIHTRLDPTAFYVIPKLKITPDKEDPEKVTAQVVIWRWYSNVAAPVPEETAAAPAETTAVPTEATATPAENPVAPAQNPAPPPATEPAPVFPTPVIPDPVTPPAPAAPAPPPSA